MAKTGGWCKKLMDKSRANATNNKLGRQRAIITRNKSPYADKRVVFNEHAKAIQGGHNPGPAETFRGDGLPDDSLAALKPPKTNAERAEQDKRAPLDDEMRSDWVARPYKRQPDSVTLLLRALR